MNRRAYDELDPMLATYTVPLASGQPCLAILVVTPEFQQYKQ